MTRVNLLLYWLAAIAFSLAVWSLVLGLIARDEATRTEQRATPVVKDSLTTRTAHALSDNPFRGMK